MTMREETNEFRNQHDQIVGVSDSWGGELLGRRTETGRKKPGRAVKRAHWLLHDVYWTKRSRARTD